MNDLASLQANIVTASVEACWRQWDVLGAMAAGGARAESIVDPEALLLLSFSMSRHERRLEDMWRWWATIGSQLTSVQRLVTLAKSFPDPGDGMEDFAAVAFEAGDRRWRRHATDSPVPSGRALKGRESPDLSSPTTLLLRMRAGMGLGAKPDILSFLISTSPREASVAEIAEATGYSSQAVRVASGDLVMARFAFEDEGRPARLFARTDAWTELLLSDRSAAGASWPRWRHWSEVFPLLAALSAWAADSNADTRYIRSTRARDVLERHSQALIHNRIDAPRLSDFRGEEMLDGISAIIERLTTWLRQHI